jgi:predicted O-methyltransferase YrrM
MMPRLQSILSAISEPGRLLERMTESRMRRSAVQYYQERTSEQNAVERNTFFSRYANVSRLVEEATSTAIYRRLVSEINTANSDTATAMSQTTSLDDCITMYVGVRAFQPRVMVETGVFYGAMSAMILSAMRQNGGGRLYSIDLPIEADQLPEHLRGALVTEELRTNWQLILGDSRVELPRLLQSLGEIDAFNHDSLHTTQHMMWEYETAWPYIRPGGTLSSHDVVMTPSWQRFCKAHAGDIASHGRVFGLGFAIKRLGS